MTRNLEAALDTSKKNIDTNQEMMKINKALMGGAKALVFVPDPLNTDSKWFDMIRGYFSGGSYTLKGNKPGSTIPVKLIFGTEALANEILKESGKTLLQLQNEINSSGTPKSFDVKNCKAEIQLIKKTKTIEGKNVIAILEGSDPVLKNECVVLSAHYDHIGIAANGDVNNGADDNGSGTVALLEIADAFTKLKKNPKRSVVFLWDTAEEKGLFGSDFYSRNPVFPLEKTLADINLDMVGCSAEKDPEKDVKLENSLCGKNGVYIISGKQSSELLKISDNVCKELNLIPSDALSKALLTRSDYYHFYKNGIPVLGVTTGLHEDYHQPSDELDKIDYNKMKRVTEFAFLVTYKVANQDKRIVVDNPVNK
jgi:Zn-dependent M28 family amino/carboxypeptidase